RSALGGRPCTHRPTVNLAACWPPSRAWLRALCPTARPPSAGSLRRRAKITGQVAPAGHAETTQAQPGRHRLQLTGQRPGDPGALNVGLAERAHDTQRVRVTVGLEVDPRGQPAVDQQRPYVIAVAAFGRGGVDLDAVVKAEQPLHPRPE